MNKVVIVGAAKSEIIPTVSANIVIGIDLFPGGVELFLKKYPDLIIYRDSFARVAPLITNIDLVIINLKKEVTIEYCRMCFKHAQRIVLEDEWKKSLNMSPNLELAVSSS